MLLLVLRLLLRSLRLLLLMLLLRLRSLRLLLFFRPRLLLLCGPSLFFLFLLPAVCRRRDSEKQEHDGCIDYSN